MSDTPFKTPINHHKYQQSHGTPRTMSERSESDESTTSDGSSTMNDLSIVAEFDDMVRQMKYQEQDSRKLEESFLHFAEESQKLFGKYCEVSEECKRLRDLLDTKVQECSETERRLKTARVILDKEKKNTQKVIMEKEELEEQLDQVRDLLFKDNKVRIGEDAREKLSFLHRVGYSTDNVNGFNINNNLSCIQEINSTGSVLSDFSLSRSEDDLDVSRSMKGGRAWKKHRPSTGGDLDPPQKRRRSSSKIIEIGPQDTVRATTTVTVTNKGPIKATSVIESIVRPEESDSNEPAPGPSSDDGIGSSVPPTHLVFEAWEKQSSPRRNTQTRSEHRQHSLQQRTIIMPDFCVCCEKRIRFGKTALKCQDCKSLCHYECKDQLRLPCVPIGNTPSNKNVMGIISDYTPTSAPMVPALIVHCANEIELRGLNEIGLYRVSASEKDVKILKEKFLKGRGVPSLNKTDVHTLCSVIKDFIRSLAEPLVTYALWHDFIKAVDAKDPQDIVPAIYQCISELPQPNRDTLAYVMLHLQKVAESPECKMPVENMAKVFGPTLVGFSSDNPQPDSLLTELRLQIAVVNQLIRLPSDYWSTFVNVTNQQPGNRMQQTPSTDSLLRPRNFTPNRIRSTKKRRFDTPPAYKLD